MDKVNEDITGGETDVEKRNNRWDYNRTNLPFS